MSVPSLRVNTCDKLLTVREKGGFDVAEHIASHYSLRSVLIKSFHEICESTLGNGEILALNPRRAGLTAHYDGNKDKRH